jgi:hypothetical protein
VDVNVPPTQSAPSSSTAPAQPAPPSSTQ